MSASRPPRRSGSALAGGYAVQAHGFLDRRSEDVDLFTIMRASETFAPAVDAAVTAYRREGLRVEIARQDPAFARLLLTDPDGRTVRVEFGIDWRAHPPVRAEVGPVLHPDDAVANKIVALYGRAAARDYIDVDGILRSKRYGSWNLVDLARNADPGFDVPMFTEALHAVHRVRGDALAEHGPAARTSPRCEDACTPGRTNWRRARTPSSETRSGPRRLLRKTTQGFLHVYSYEIANEVQLLLPCPHGGTPGSAGLGTA